MINSMRRQLNQAKEDLNAKELELEAQMRRGQIEDKERGMIDRKEKTRLQREMDTLQRNFNDLDQQRRREIESLKDELKQLSQESKRNAELKDTAMHREQEVTKNHLQQQLRSLMSSEGNLLTEKEKL